MTISKLKLGSYLSNKMQYIIRPFLTPREKEVQDGLKETISAVDSEENARSLQSAFFKDKVYNPVLGLIVYISNSYRDSMLASMTLEQLKELKQDCIRISKSRSEIKKLAEKIRLDENN